MIDKELIDRKKAVPIVEGMEPSELEGYIEKRLKGISIYPPLNADESPEYFLEKIYESSKDEGFKSKFRSVIAELLKREQNKISNADYVSTLLIFCEQYIISEAIVSVSGMALSGQLKGINSIDGDLHHRALMALARMPQGMEMTDIWVSAIDDSRYTAAAFAALREQGLEKICRHLPYFIRMHRKNPESIDMNIALITLYDRFAVEGFLEDEITSVIIRSFVNENLGQKREIRNLLENLGKKNPFLFLNEDKKSISGVKHEERFFQLKSSLCGVFTQREDKIRDIEAVAINIYEYLAAIENNPTREKKWFDMGAKRKL